MTAVVEVPIRSTVVHGQTGAVGPQGPVGSGDIPLDTAGYIRISGGNLPTGYTDLYTVPAGKRLLVRSISYRNEGVGTVTVRAQLKSSGVYYPLQSNTTTIGAGANSGVLAFGTPLVLDAGESLAVQTAEFSGLNFWAKATPYANTYPLRSQKTLTLASGDNTIYTCSNARGTQIGYAPSDTGTIFIGNSSGITRNYNIYVVPSGQSVAAQYRIVSSSITNGGIANTACAVALSLGDFIVVNMDGGGDQFAYITVFEPEAT